MNLREPEGLVISTLFSKVSLPLAIMVPPADSLIEIPIEGSTLVPGIDAAESDVMLKPSLLFPSRTFRSISPDPPEAVSAAGCSYFPASLDLRESEDIGTIF